MRTDTLIILLHQALKEPLRRHAADTDLTEAELAAQAIEEFLAVQDRQVARIKNPIASADRGQAVSHEEAAAWVAWWGTDAEKPGPRR